MGEQQRGYKNVFDAIMRIAKEDGISGIANQFCSSMSAGLIYSIVTMPFETAKNRMAFQKLDPITKEMPYRGTFQTIGKIAAADGVLSLWWGFLPYYGRCGGAHRDHVHLRRPDPDSLPEE